MHNITEERAERCRLRRLKESIAVAEHDIALLRDRSKRIENDIAGLTSYISDCRTEFGNRFLLLQNSMSYRRFCKLMGINQ